MATAQVEALQWRDTLARYEHLQSAHHSYADTQMALRMANTAQDTYQRLRQEHDEKNAELRALTISLAA